MDAVVLPTKALLNPLDAVPRSVDARRWAWPLILLSLCAVLAGTAFAVRWEAGPEVIHQLQADGELSHMSEHDLSEKIQQAERTKLVAGIAKGVFVTPLMAVLLAAVLWAVGWLFDRKAAFGRYMSAAAVALLPIALANLAFAACVWAQASITEGRAPWLVPSNLAALVHPQSLRLKTVLSAVDLFKLWSVGLLGLGFAAATGMSRSRALVLGFVLYVLYVGVFMIGLPAMQMAGGPR